MTPTHAAITVAAMAAVALSAAALLVGCDVIERPARADGAAPVYLVDDQRWIVVLHDERRHVTCWALRPMFRIEGGISCLPDSQIGNGVSP